MVERQRKRGSAPGEPSANIVAVTEIRWSAPTRADDGAWLGLLAAIEQTDAHGEVYSSADIDDEWASVWAHPDSDAIFGWNGPDLVAFAWLKAVPGEREAHRVGCWGGVHPAHRRRGIGTSLFDWMLRQATEISTRFTAPLPVTVQVEAHAHQTDVMAVARQAGFEPVRHFLEVARSAATPVPDVAEPAGLDLVRWSAELDEEVRLAHLESFADHWGSEPRTPEAWAQWYTGHRAFRPDLSALAIDPVSGQVASLVLCAAYPQDWGVAPIEAWVNTVGTRPSWRGKGVARWLLAESLRRIAAAPEGFERAILGVDEENPTGALRLYRDLGFTTDVRRMVVLAREPLG